MLGELNYAIGELVVYAPPDSNAEDDAREAIVIENALDSAADVEIHIEGEAEPRLVKAGCIVRQVSRFRSSSSSPDDETLV